MKSKHWAATSAMAVIVGTLAVSTSIGISTAGAWEACPPAVAAWSPNSSKPTSITFVLDAGSSFPVDIVWLDHSGKMQKFNRLVPGQSYTQSTFVGHAWIAKDGESCEYFYATDKHLTANIVLDNSP